jgi:hypothetical protein
VPCGVLRSSAGFDSPVSPEQSSGKEQGRADRPRSAGENNPAHPAQPRTVQTNSSSLDSELIDL